MDSEKKKYVLDLVEKLQDGSATKAEIKVLIDFYITFQQSEVWPLDIESKHIIKESIFKNIQTGIRSSSKKDTKVISIKYRNYIKYAVAACLVLTASVVFFLNKDNQESITPIIVNDVIPFGTDKAILTLGDGTSVSLESNHAYNNSNISSNGEKLVYAQLNEADSVETSYNVLTVPRGGQFFVELSDGTNVWLNSETQLKYPVNFVDGKPRNVELVYGEAYFNVSPSKSHKGSKFSIESNHQKIEVIGTQFNIAAYTNEEFIYTTLVEGKVSIVVDEVKKNLAVNQQAILNSKTQYLQIENVDVYNYISWREGVFSFNQMPLSSIMKVLSRWYDVDIKFENKNIQTTKFNGTLRKDQNLEDILEIIKSTNNLTFKIENKIVTLK